MFHLDCNATGTLLNIANAYERLADLQNAIFALEAYVKRKPDADDVEKIKRRIENLRTRLASMPAPTASASASAAPTTSASIGTPPELPPPPPVKPYGVAPWITVGVGGAALVAGAILLPIGLGNVGDVQKSAPGGEDVSSRGSGCFEVEKNTRTAIAKSKPGSGQWLCVDQASYDQAVRGQYQSLFGKIALGVGGAAVAGGIVWELLFNKPVAAGSTTPAEKKPTGSVHFAPSFSPDMTGAFVHGSF